MNLPTIILALIGCATLIGGVAVFFKRGGDKEASELDQNTIRAYRDSEVIKDRLIESLKVQLQTKEDIIERLLNDGRQSKKSRR